MKIKQTEEAEMFEKMYAGDVVEVVEGEHEGRCGEYYATALGTGHLVFLKGDASPTAFRGSQIRVIDSQTRKNIAEYLEMTANR